MAPSVAVDGGWHRLWQSVAVCGSLWQSVAVCGSLWQSVAVCGSLWQSVAVCGSLWQSVAVCGSLWQSVAVVDGTVCGVVDGTVCGSGWWMAPSVVVDGGWHRLWWWWQWMVDGTVCGRGWWMAPSVVVDGTVCGRLWSCGSVWQHRLWDKSQLASEIVRSESLQGVRELPGVGALARVRVCGGIVARKWHDVRTGLPVCKAFCGCKPADCTCGIDNRQFRKTFCGFLFCSRHFSFCVYKGSSCVAPSPLKKPHCISKPRCISRPHCISRPRCNRKSGCIKKSCCIHSCAVFIAALYS